MDPRVREGDGVSVCVGVRDWRCRYRFPPPSFLRRQEPAIPQLRFGAVGLVGRISVGQIRREKLSCFLIVGHQFFTSEFVISIDYGLHKLGMLPGNITLAIVV